MADSASGLADWVGWWLGDCQFCLRHYSETVPLNILHGDWLIHEPVHLSVFPDLTFWILT